MSEEIKNQQSEDKALAVEETAQEQASDGTGKTEIEKLSLTQEELDEIIAKRVAREKKKFADYEEVKKKAQEYEKQLEELRNASREKDIRAEFYSVAQKEGIAYLDDAYRLADLAAVEYGEDGVKGVEEIVKALVESKPFLLAQQEARQVGTPSNPPKESEAKTKAQLLEVAAQKARSGRPEDMAAYVRLKRELGL